VTVAMAISTVMVKSCVPCKPGTNCSTIGTALATQSLVSGYWRASTTSTDILPCWFPGACSGNSNGTAAVTDIPNNCIILSSGSTNVITTSGISSSGINSSSISSSTLDTSKEHGVYCDDTSTTSISSIISIAGITQLVNAASYCAQGYRGPCKYCTTHFTIRCCIQY
jgi:hypothetical protein